MRPFLLLLFLSTLPGAADNAIRGFPAESLESERAWEQKARAVPEPERIREYIRRISDEPHHAGSPASKAIAEYLAGLLRGWGYETSIEEFEALLPTGADQFDR